MCEWVVDRMCMCICCVCVCSKCVNVSVDCGSNMKSFVLHRCKQQFGVVCETNSCGLLSPSNLPQFDGCELLLSSLAFLPPLPSWNLLRPPFDSILSFLTRRCGCCSYRFVGALVNRKTFLISCEYFFFFFSRNEFFLKQNHDAGGDEVVEEEKSQSQRSSPEDKSILCVRWADAAG